MSGDYNNLFIMFNISEFLEKFKGFGASERATKDALIAAVKNCVGAEIERGDISFRSGVAYIRTSHMVKNQVYIKKEKILECFGAEIKPKINDIR